MRVSIIDAAILAAHEATNSVITILPSATAKGAIFADSPYVDRSVTKAIAYAKKELAEADMG